MICDLAQSNVEESNREGESRRRTLIRNEVTRCMYCLGIVTCDRVCDVMRGGILY